jgi:hypothetical protein
MVDLDVKRNGTMYRLEHPQTAGLDLPPYIGFATSYLASGVLAESGFGKSDNSTLFVGPFVFVTLYDVRFGVFQ